jgi:hypothetical protein
MLFLFFSIITTSANAEMYSQVSIKLDPFLGKEGSKILKTMPENLWTGINYGLSKGHDEFKSIKYKEVRFYLNKKDKKGLLLTNYEGHKNNINNFYDRVQREKVEFVKSFCKRNGVDYLFMWSPSIIQIERKTITVRLDTYYPAPNIIKPAPIELPIKDINKTYQIIGETVHNHLQKIYTGSN